MDDGSAAGLASRPGEFETLVASLPDVVFRLDAALRHTFVSPRVQQWLGIPPERFLGRTARDAGIDPEVCDRFEEAARRVLASGRPEQLEFTSREHALRARILPERDARGAVGSLMCIIEDVTQRKREEAEHQRAAEQLRQQASLLDVLGDAVVATDASFHVTTWNRSAEAMYGFTAREALGAHIDELLQTEFPEGVEAIAGPLRDVGAARLELVHHTKDGVPLRVQASVVGLRDAEGRAAGTLGILRDVTEHRRREKALLDSDRRKTEFLAVLSHELRNPLAPIRNCIYLLGRAAPGSDQAIRLREVLRRQTDHLTRLVDDLLDLTRIDRGKIELRMTTLDAVEVVRRTCHDNRDLFTQRAVNLELAEAADRAWVRADPARLAQMVGNLLNNALKYTAPGGHVRVGVERRGDRYALTVQDDGVGIEPADLERIFDPFVQAERTRHGPGHGGLGIGLALVRDLAARHGGAIQARSAGPGQGAEFTLLLPRAEPAAVLASGLSRAAAADPLSVLIIEDNLDAAATLAELLALKGHRTEQAITGRGGIDAVAAHPPDVLVCDVGLPDMLGYDVVRAVRAMPAGREVFAVALTGYAQPHDRELAAAAGFDAHLAKPAPEEELDALLLQAARRRGTPPATHAC